MISPRTTLACAALAGLLAAVPAAAAVQNPIDPQWTVETSIGVLTDYRYRGYSLSDNQPAVQARVTASHAGGIYVDAYLSTIDEYGAGSDGKGAQLEATLSAGWTGQVGGVDLDVGVSAYRYPGGTDVDYYEIPVQAGRTFGSLIWTFGAAWAPDGQTALGGEENRYVWTSLDFAPEEWRLRPRASLGFEDGAYAPEGKTDWLLGLTTAAGQVTLAADYVDSDSDKGALVVSAFAAF